VLATTHKIRFDGHNLAYRVHGRGPAVVIVSQYWQPVDEVRDRLLGTSRQVFHVTPIGYGKSARVPGYAGQALPDQVLAILERHGVDRFVVWGYSAGGAMAACVARATPRVAGLVCGGFALFKPQTPGVARRLDRRLPPDHASRSLWPWVNSIDWFAEVPAMPCSAMFYWGATDRQMATALRVSQQQLLLDGVDFVEFPGLNHPACNDREALETLVVPSVEEWITRRCALS
jgi:pimeloyl-ACP methyl ester carboxylesterase